MIRSQWRKEEEIFYSTGKYPEEEEEEKETVASSTSSSSLESQVRKSFKESDYKGWKSWSRRRVEVCSSINWLLHVTPTISDTLLLLPLTLNNSHSLGEPITIHRRRQTPEEVEKSESILQINSKTFHRQALRGTATSLPPHGNRRAAPADGEARQLDLAQPRAVSQQWR